MIVISGEKAVYPCSSMVTGAPALEEERVQWTQTLSRENDWPNKQKIILKKHWRKKITPKITKPEMMPPKNGLFTTSECNMLPEYLEKNSFINN